MPDKKSIIEFEKVRSPGIGRLTSFTESTCDRPGYLAGSNRGLFYLSGVDSKPVKIRRWPVVWIISGDNGVVCYEEVSRHGRLAILDGNLTEKSTNSELARTINPKAYYSRGLIILHRDNFEYLDLETYERSHLARFAPCRAVGPFLKTASGYEFIAVERGPKWPTFLYSLRFSDVENPRAEAVRIGCAEDPIIARHFLRFPNGDYLIIPLGQTRFLTYRLFDGEPNGFRTWMLVNIPGDIHPVGLVLAENKLFLAGMDGIVTFKLDDELCG